MNWEEIHQKALFVIKDTAKARLTPEDRKRLEINSHYLFVIQQLCSELGVIIRDRLAPRPKKVTK